MRGDSKSSYKPGIAEMMGVGAIAGHLLTSTLVSGALAGGTGNDGGHGGERRQTAGRQDRPGSRPILRRAGLDSA